MQRRTVLGIGMAGLLAVALPQSWIRGFSAEVEKALDRLAAARRQAGLSSLSLRPVLVRMAHLQARHMAGSGAVTHLDAANHDPEARARLAGYGGHVLGEALAETFDGPTETVAFWLAHPPTRDVILDPAARDLGLAMRRGDDGRIWWNLIVGT